MITHHMTRSQVEQLAEVFAKPEEWNGEIVWYEPIWIGVMRSTAKEDPPVAIDFIL